jgi:hypothetical protein
MYLSAFIRRLLTSLYQVNVDGRDRLGAVGVGGKTDLLLNKIYISAGVLRCEGGCWIHVASLMVKCRGLVTTSVIFKLGNFLMR